MLADRYKAVMSALCALLPAHRRSTPIAASVVTMIPVGIFLLSSINPSAWALIAGAIVPLALVGYFETHGLRRYTRGAHSQAVNLGSDSTWWWDAIVPGPMAVWAIGTVAFIALIVVLLRRFHYPNEDPGESSGNDQRNTQFSGAIQVACNP